MEFLHRLSIPRIECNNLTSSGYLVTDDIVITALHAIKPYLQEEVESIKVIFINEQGEEVEYNAKPIEPKDDWEEYEIICLRLSHQLKNIEFIKCIDYRFYSTTECLTYGYPAVAQEKGTLIDIEIRNEFKDVDVNFGANLDIKVLDPIKDYSGYSGSPLLYNNQAVAVMLEQASENTEASRLYAVSLYIYRNYLNSIGVSLITKQHESEYEEYISSIKQMLQQQLENNLKRNIEKNKVNPLGFSIFIQPKKSIKEEVSFNEILEDDQSIIIMSRPGGGKTYLLHMLMLDIIENPQISIGKIPIYLKAKEWYRSYESVVGGIKKELEYYSPKISEQQIIENLREGQYILLIDGLDEIINNKDLFISEIRKVSQFNKTKIIITCRQQNYHNEFYNLLSEYSLKALSDKQIQEYIEAVFEEEVYYGYIHELKNQLKDLIENPLFLYMTTHIMKEMTSKVIPKNKSELYEMFISYIMQEKLLKDGTYQESLHEIDIKEAVLMEFAYLNFRKKNDSVKLREVINNYIQDQMNINSLKKEILQAGVLVEENNKVDFFHPSIEEYFVALKLSKLPKEEILNFIESNYSNEGYYEVFKFTSGLLRNYDQKNLILEKLETLDIFLYRQCLESKFNFDSNIDEIWSNDYLEEYFTQVRRSYLNIIDNFFGNIKQEFYPWFSDKKLYSNDKVAIVGALNRNKSTLSIELVKNHTNDKKVFVSEEAGAATMETRDKQGNVISTPIITFQSSNHWYFNLEQTKFGLDSAREVALYIVKNQLKKLLENHRLFSYEAPETIVPCIELIFKSLPSQYFSVQESNGESNKVSLNKHPAPLIFNVLSYRENILKYIESRSPYGYLNQEFVGIILYNFFELIKTKLEFKDYLLLQSDIEPNRNTSSKWELWSEERIIERLKQFFIFYQNGYRNLIEQCFFSIHQHMRLYAAGPVRFEIGLEKHNNNYSGISVEWFPVETFQETTPAIKEEKAKWFGDEGFDGKLAEIDQELLKFNRKLVGGHSLQSSALDQYLFDDLKLREMVYKEIIDELEYVLGELK